jgi:acetyltransferase-like isoleucine patch superfamily enzyme
MADLACFARYCYSWCCTRLCLLPVKKRGKDIWLQSPCRFASHTEIGDGCRFGGIEIAGSGNCTIGSHVHCGKQVTVLTDAPDYDGGRKLPCGEENIPGDVVIGDNVWIGQGVTVLAGVTIGEGAVIQAGSTVCDDIAPLAVAAGYPAKAYYSRNAEHYYALKEKQSR